jgi:hypothetical protein
MALVPHAIDIGGAETFLAGGQTPMGGGLLAGEVRLELDHACTGEKQSGIPFRHQGGTGHHPVPISSEEIEKPFSYLLAAYGPDHESHPFYVKYPCPKGIPRDGKRGQVKILRQLPLNVKP